MTSAGEDSFHRHSKPALDSLKPRRQRAMTLPEGSTNCGRKLSGFGFRAFLTGPSKHRIGGSMTKALTNIHGGEGSGHR